MSQNKDTATFNTSVVHTTPRASVACTTVSEVHVGNHFVKIKEDKSRSIVCVWKYTSKYGVLGGYVWVIF